MTQQEEGIWTRGGGTGFGAYSARDEGLHPEHRLPGDTLTESWAYMWYVPEADISFLAYVWVHPNLNVLSSGLMGWRGHKRSHMSAELFDFRAYLSHSNDTDMHNLQIPSGMRIRIIEPFERIMIDYDHPASGNSVAVEFTAFSPPIMRESRLHFDQAMRAQGTVTLRGRTYAIDGFGMRDRSWGELRPEINYPLPPYTWMTGTFPKSRMSWHVCAHDDPRLNPIWSHLYAIEPKDAMHDGWLFRDGELLRLKDVSAFCTRDPDTLRPVSHRVSFTDLRDRNYLIEGRVKASLPWGVWPNSCTYLCMTEWSWNGEIAYGDTQEVQWNDFVHALRKDQQPYVAWPSTNP